MNTPTIYRQNKSSWWWYSWSTENGTRYRHSLKFLHLSTETHTKEQALESLLAFLGLADPLPDTSNGYTLDVMLWDMPRRLESEGIREGTVAGYRRSLGKLVQFLGGNYLVSNISTVPHVAGFKMYLLEQGVSPVTVNRHLRELQCCFNRLLDDGAIGVNPFARFKRLRVDKGKPAHLSPEQVQSYLKTVQSWQPVKPLIKPVEIEAMKRIMYLYLYTGRRRAEIPQVKRTDISTVHWTVSVPNVKKRGNPHDVITIPEPVREDVRWFLNNFPGEYPFQFCKIDLITRYAKLWMRLTGLPESLHLHSLRHTAITLWIEAGISPRTIQDYVGHSTIAVTEGYVHGKRREDMHFGHDFRG